MGARVMETRRSGSLPWGQAGLREEEGSPWTRLPSGWRVWLVERTCEERWVMQCVRVKCSRGAEVGLGAWARGPDVTEADPS